MKIILGFMGLKARKNWEQFGKAWVVVHTFDPEGIGVLLFFSFLFFFLRRSFFLVTQAGVQWCSYSLP